MDLKFLLLKGDLSLLCFGTIHLTLYKDSDAAETNMKSTNERLLFTCQYDVVSQEEVFVLFV
eukprot:m.304524 g.304524  ORF g.304524 m.304524 type:complete len:62 (+) comp15901_c0_seq2:3094-3279(+)